MVKKKVVRAKKAAKSKVVLYDWVNRAEGINQIMLNESLPKTPKDFASYMTSCFVNRRTVKKYKITVEEI